MKILATLGRIIFGLSLIVFATNPLLHADQTAATIPFPMAKMVTYLAGVLLLAGGICLVMNRWVHLTMLMVAVLLIARALTIHYPNFSEPDYAVMILSVMNMTKDLGLAGAALLLTGLSWPAKGKVG